MKRIPLVTVGAVVGSILIAGCGCSLLAPRPTPAPSDLPPAVIVITADRWQYPMTNSVGIRGWFVPAAVHAEYAEAVALVDYYRSLNQPPKGPSK